MFYLNQDYLGSIEYRDGQIEAIYHEEGKISITPEGYQNEYYLKDHLGNVRVVFSDKNQDGEIEPTKEILQESHYYPFGMAMDGFSQNYTTTGATNRYTYNGKELNGDLGLDLHDYGARWYDAGIGRWNAVDPLAEISLSWSPYNYVENTPINAIDPDGRSCVGCEKNGENYSGDPIQGLTSNGEGNPDYYLNLKTGTVEHHEGSEDKLDEGLVHLAGDDATVGGIEDALSAKNYESQKDPSVSGGYKVDTKKQYKAWIMMQIYSVSNLGIILGSTITANLYSAGQGTQSALMFADDLIGRPKQIWGKSADEIAAEFRKAGYQAVVEQSTKKGTSGKAIQVRIKGHRNITNIQVHPGGGRHGGSYYKISTSTHGKIKVVDPKTYIPLKGEKTTILNYN